MKLKKGDKVIVIAGKDKGKSGVIERALPADDRVVISGVNIRKVHQRARRAGEKGQIIEMSAPIHVSNVALVENNKAVRVGRKVIDGKKVRISKKSGNAI